ncbi:MAG: MFS transporter [Candidatus Sumerlaeota bacterium]|nr:MFS transporter [Candidatus Sumerlaeota bacterium]
MTFRRPQYLLFASALLDMVYSFLAVTIQQIGKDQLGASASLLGAYGFASMLIYIPLCFVSGRASEKWGRGFVMAIGMSLLALACALLLAMQHKYLIFVPLLLVGASGGIIWPVVEAALSDGQTPGQIKRATGYFNISWLSAMGVAAIIAGALYSWNPNAPIVASIVIILALLAIMSRPETMRIAPWGVASAEDHESSAPAGLGALFIQLAFIGNLTAYLLISCYRSLLAEYALPVGITGWRFGLLAGSVTLGTVLSNVILLIWRSWHYSLRILIGAEVLVIALLVVFVSVNSYILLVTVSVLLGLPLGLIYYSSLYYGLEQCENRGAHGGNHEALIGAGLTLGPLFGGWAIALTGFTRANFVLCAFFFVGAIFFQQALYRRRMKKISVAGH